MVAAIRQTVTVGPDGTIEIRAPEFRAGEQAEVIVLLGSPADAGASATGEMTWGKFLGSGKGLFKSVEQVDAHIRELRDEWER